MTMTTTSFQDVRPIYDGGEGVPVPVYLCTYRGEPITTFGVGHARKALDWLRGRDFRFAVYALVDGVRREVARGL